MRKWITVGLVASLVTVTALAQELQEKKGLFSSQECDFDLQELMYFFQGLPDNTVFRNHVYNLEFDGPDPVSREFKNQVVEQNIRAGRDKGIGIRVKSSILPWGIGDLDQAHYSGIDRNIHGISKLLPPEKMNGRVLIEKQIGCNSIDAVVYESQPPHVKASIVEVGRIQLGKIIAHDPNHLSILNLATGGIFEISVHNVGKGGIQGGIIISRDAQAIYAKECIGTKVHHEKHIYREHRLFQWGQESSARAGLPEYLEIDENNMRPLMTDYSLSEMEKLQGKDGRSCATPSGLQKKDLDPREESGGSGGWIPNENKKGEYLRVNDPPKDDSRSNLRM